MSMSLTISNLDDETYRRLQADALLHGSDVESIARNALTKGLAADRAISPANGPPYRDLDFMAGTWTEAETQEFLEIVGEFRRIDPEIWQ